eukprot:15522001-Heterocapsa_arctica.AAC.1
MGKLARLELRVATVQMPLAASPCRRCVLPPRHANPGASEEHDTLKWLFQCLALGAHHAHRVHEDHE